ncbi:MAG TPA: FtsX-like permease family protein, partial [Flavobacteriia bacterium]|nr:FtsX-like permease family protein [Flavobacteriia bacterium]
LLLASVNGMKNGFINQFKDDATNSIFIIPNVTALPYDGFEAGRRIKFTNDDLKYIQGNFKDDIEYITPRYQKGVTAKYKKETGTYSVRAVLPDYKKIEKTIVTKGRYLNQNDVDKKLKVVVIGKKIQEDLFGDEDPIGKTIILNNSTFKVIGVFEDEGNDRENRILYVPITTLQRLYKNTDVINSIALTYNPSYSLSQALEFSNRIETIMKRRHRIDPDDRSGIYVSDYAEQFSNVNNFTMMLTAISVFVGILILVAGIIGVGNILVFIIKERTKEIGIRKAIGAKPSQIINLVILESVFITTISGIGGMLFAMGLVKLVGKGINSPAFSNPQVKLGTVLIATSILVIAGVLAGLVPAIKAARVKPIEALNAD